MGRSGEEKESDDDYDDDEVEEDQRDISAKQSAPAKAVKGHPLSSSPKYWTDTALSDAAIQSCGPFSVLTGR